jgi:hypothetical protein
MHLRQAARLPLPVRLLLVAAALLRAGAQPCEPGAAAAACDSVLVVHAFAGGHAPEAAVVQQTLVDTGAFATVDAFDATRDTPTAAQLAAYHAVLVVGDIHSQIVGGPGVDDPNLLGDRLAAYHDQGGGVVIAVANASWLAGAYGEAANGYVLLDYAAEGLDPYDFGPDMLGAVLEPQSPLLADVHSLAASFSLRSTAPAVGDRAVVVARWRGGRQEPLVLRGQRRSRTLVELNIFPVPSAGSGWPDGWWPGGWTGDGAALLRNALKFSRCMLCGPGTYSPTGEWRCGSVGRGGVATY